MAAAKKPAENPSGKSGTTVTAANKKAAEAEKRAEQAEAKIKRLARQAERLKALDKVGVGGKVQGFFNFLREQAVVGLAIGIVIGSQVQNIAKSLVNDFINPLVALLMPGSGDLANKAFYVHRAGEHPQKFLWGDFVSALISFVILIAVIYFVIKGLKLDRLDKKKEEAKK